MKNVMSVDHGVRPFLRSARCRSSSARRGRLRWGYTLGVRLLGLVFRDTPLVSSVSLLPKFVRRTRTVEVAVSSGSIRCRCDKGQPGVRT